MVIPIKSPWHPHETTVFWRKKIRRCIPRRRWWSAKSCSAWRSAKAISCRCQRRGPRWFPRGYRVKHGKTTIDRWFLLIYSVSEWDIQGTKGISYDIFIFDGKIIQKWGWTNMASWELPYKWRFRDGCGKLDVESHGEAPVENDHCGFSTSMYSKRLQEGNHRNWWNKVDIYPSDMDMGI